jgi:uncharacterized C2H2 Zn-finger protein
LSCACDTWQEIRGIERGRAHDDLLNLIDERIDAGQLEAVEPQEPQPFQAFYDGKQRWFRCTSCGRIWRLVEAAGAITGRFERFTEGGEVAWRPIPHRRRAEASCVCDGWEIRNRFSSQDDFERTRKWLEERIASGDAVRVDDGSGWDVVVRCPACGRLWRLSPPDGPFAGVFAPLESD